MRLLSAAAALALALSSSLALASEVASSKDKAGAQGGALGSSGAAPQGESGTGGGSAPGLRADGDASGRKWSVDGTYEFHRLVRQNDLEGAGANKAVNFFYLSAAYRVGEHGRLRLGIGLYERFLADGGETGLRTTDLSLAYVHEFALPREVTLRLTGSLSAPTSFDSMLSSLITAPGLTVQAERSFGCFTLDVRLFGHYFWPRFTSAAGGNANARTSLGALLTGEYKLPWVHALTVGADLYTGYVWFYEVGTPPAAEYYGAVQDQQFAAQPMLQSYGGELYGRYELPKFHGLASDLTVAFAQGDPTLGYTSRLHDGIAYTYTFWRLNSEVYAALNAKF